jgi:hypothetical protein
MRHDLGTTIVPHFDSNRSIVTLVATVKSYLVPDEIGQTEYFRKVSLWDGTFDNYGREQCWTYRIQVDTEINLEESNIVRKDYATCYGLLVEFVFTKKIRNGAHLKPTLTWTILEEGTRQGQGFKENLEKAVAQRSGTNTQ